MFFLNINGYTSTCLNPRPNPKQKAIQLINTLIPQGLSFYLHTCQVDSLQTHVSTKAPLSKLLRKQLFYQDQISLLNQKTFDLGFHHQDQIFIIPSLLYNKWPNKHKQICQRIITLMENHHSFMILI